LAQIVILGELRAGVQAFRQDETQIERKSDIRIAKVSAGKASPVFPAEELCIEIFEDRVGVIIRGPALEIGRPSAFP
jgi:hypothetical protein